MSRHQPRIVSLIPSASEIVCALGFQSALVGRSHECDYPPGVERLPVCSKPRLNIHAASEVIDRDVKALVRDGLSVYEVLEHVLRDLAPDVIVTQTQCDVCAVSEADVKAAVAQWTGSRPDIVSLAPNTLLDVWADIGRVADALDAHSSGLALIQTLSGNVEDLTTPAVKDEAPTVACIEWIDPLMCAGNWAPELVERAGGKPLLATAGEHSPWIEWAALRAADPDVIVIMPCGFDLERTATESEKLTHHAGWSELRAVREQQVYITDGHQYFNRPGPRLVDSLEILCAVLAPQTSPRRERHTDGWRPYLA